MIKYKHYLLRGMAVGGIAFILMVCGQSEADYITQKTEAYLDATGIQERLEIHREVREYLNKQYRLFEKETLQDLDDFNQEYCSNMIENNPSLNERVQVAFKNKQITTLPCVVAPDGILESMYI